ncbi:MAG: RNA polymerase sigma factor [Chitinophagaceae bacterium]
MQLITFFDFHKKDLWIFFFQSSNIYTYFTAVNKKQFDNISDDELLEKYYQSHNNEWLGILLQRYTLLLFGTCMKYLKDETKASDTVQQVFLKAIDELAKYKVTYFKSWIYMIAKNNCLMQLRNKNITADISEYHIQDDSLDIDELKLKEVDYHFLEKSIEELNDEQKLCINLFYLQKKSYNEIVTATNFTLMQVKSNIQNGKRNLKISIEKKRMQQ